MLIADNDVNFAKSLRSFLDAEKDIRVIDTVRDGQGAVNACHKELPDLILMDLHLPVLDSIRAIKSILAQNDRIKILGVSSIPNDRYAVEAIKAGACGYLDKNICVDYPGMAQAIRQVANGEVVINSNLATSILKEFHKLAD
jgi:DNA-binding NarL/FixJ family response regulator